GFGGQAFMAEVLPKITSLNAQMGERPLSVDGGISRDTIAVCATAGANAFIAGTALFREPDLAAGVAELRALAAREEGA
ncbi:MAG: ribulose-phosphate 3-epimerase, partial [Kiritimatiellae bacterium]|nr:ribulose-phosphate 3-epimerase [Kiritimatiellia bacterium]